MKLTYFHPKDYPRPKRGDLMQTNVGNRRERTFIVLHGHPLPHGICPLTGAPRRRTQVFALRWWELEEEMRMALWRSAERAGGQVVHQVYRFPPKQKQSFEQYMRRNR